MDGKQRDIWVYEWARDTLTQVTFGGNAGSPVWTPDGRRIVFGSDRAKAGISSLYWVNADGTGVVTRLTDSSDRSFYPSWHPTGKCLAFSTEHAGTSTGYDVMILPMEGDDARGWTPGTPTVFVGTPAVEVNAEFSPDGRWIAYVSNEAPSGAIDIYVRPFPGPGGQWRVSTEGGSSPRWSATAHELLFLANDNKIMFAPYTVVGDAFRADTPQIWSPTSIRGTGTGNTGYDLHPGGKRVATSVEAEQASIVEDKVVFVSNFGDYLRTITK